MKIKNYLICFISGRNFHITAEQARKVIAAWNAGFGSITINDDTFACHQIISVTRDRTREYEAVQEHLGVQMLNDEGETKIRNFIKENEASLSLQAGGSKKQLKA